MDRRTFLRNSCTYCILAGTGLLAGSMSSCASFPVVEMEARDRRLAIPLTAFRNQDLFVVHVSGMLYDLAVRRRSPQEYVAVLLRCTHADNELTPGTTGYSCSAHGSRFDAEGNVARGPAQKSLTRYPTTVNGDFVSVDLSERRM